MIGRAIIRDLYDRDRAASMIGWVTMAMVVAPMIAPLIGGALDTALGWQAIFALHRAVRRRGARLGVVRRCRRRATVAAGEGFAHFLAASGSLLGDRAFLGYALVATFNSAMFFTFIGGAPHVVVTIMHRSSAEYGLWFVAISLGYMVGNFAAGRWSANTASTS